MNVYAYYQEVRNDNGVCFNQDSQKRLIDLWKFSWKKAGFTPHVLNESNLFHDVALKNLYTKFIQDIHIEVTGKPLREFSYHMNAHMKLLAFSSVKESSFFCDYDILNIGFGYTKDIEVSKQLCWRDFRCTCFCSGNSEGIKKYFEFLFSEKQAVIDFCSSVYQKTERAFHDQDFLQGIYNKGLETNVFTALDTRSVANPNPADFKTDNLLFHVSNRATGERIQHDTGLKDWQFSGNDHQQIRIQIAEELLGLSSHKKISSTKT